MYLYLPKCTWHFDEIRKQNSFTGEFAEALQFCHQWLNGGEAFTLHTSGSTGKPKPIRVKRQQMAFSAHGTLKKLGLTSSDHALVCLSTDFVAGKMMLVRAMEGGFSATIVPPTSQLFPPLESSGATFAAMVPLQVDQLLKQPNSASFAQLKHLLIGGAAISASLERRLQKLAFPHCYHTYGMTETVSHVALRKLNGPNASPFFTALEGNTFRTDAQGCLLIDSPAAIERPLATNDRVELLNERQFRWLGRADFVINSGGIKIQLETIENQAEKALSEEETPPRLAAVGLPHPQLGQMLTLVIEAATWELAQLNIIHQKIKNGLPKFHAPKAYAFLPKFPETPTAKINRKALQKLIESNPEIIKHIVKN